MDKKTINKKLEILRKEKKEYLNSKLTDSFERYQSKMERFNDEILKLETELILSEDLIITPFKDDDDIYSIKDFIESCENGWITDYDGFGYYATDEGCTEIIVDIDDLLEGKGLKQFSKVVWFNK